MNNLNVVVMKSPENPSVWVAKCYIDGNIDTVRTFPTAKQAQDWAADWLAYAVDHGSVLTSENN